MTTISIKFYVFPLSCFLQRKQFSGVFNGRFRKSLKNSTKYFFERKDTRSKKYSNNIEIFFEILSFFFNIDWPLSEVFFWCARKRMYDVVPIEETRRGEKCLWTWYFFVLLLCCFGYMLHFIAQIELGILFSKQFLLSEFNFLPHWIYQQTRGYQIKNGKSL